MSRISYLQSKTDAYVNKNVQHRNYGSQGILRVNGNGGTQTKRAFIYFPLPKDFRKLKVIKAYLDVFELSDFTGTTVTVQRVTSKWKESTITWANQPNFSGLHSASLAMVGGGGGQVDTFDVTDMMSDVAAGDNWHGFEIEIGTDGNFDLYSTEAQDTTLHPTLRMELAAFPDPPDQLHPDDRSLYTDEPTLRWHVSRVPLSGGSQQYTQVQISVPDGGGHPQWDVLLYDSTQVANTFTSWHLSEDVTYTSGSHISDGQLYFWRVRWWDEDGVKSDWSDPATLEYNAPGTLAVLSPAADFDTVQDTTPTLIWGWDAGPSGNDQALVRTILYKALTGYSTTLDDLTGWKLILDSGWKTDFDIDVGGGGHTSQGSWVPDEAKVTVDLQFYRLDVFVDDGPNTDGMTRARLDLNSPHAFRIFQLDLSAPTVDPPTNLTVTEAPDTLGLTLSWERSSTPDEWLVYIDGDTKPDRVFPGDDPFDGGTSYSWTWYGARPYETHDFQVRAKTDGVGVSQPSNTAQGKLIPQGIFLVEANEGLVVPINGAVEVEETLSRDGNTFYLLNRRDPVRIDGIPRGYYGQVQGTLTLDERSNVHKKLDDLEEIFGLFNNSPNLRLIYGNHSYGVVVSDLKKKQWPIADDLTYDISFNFWQTSDFEVPGPNGF